MHPCQCTIQKSFIEKALMNFNNFFNKVLKICFLGCQNKGTLLSVFMWISKNQVALLINIDAAWLPIGNKYTSSRETCDGFLSDNVTKLGGIIVIDYKVLCVINSLNMDICSKGLSNIFDIKIYWCPCINKVMDSVSLDDCIN